MQTTMPTAKKKVIATVAVKSAVKKGSKRPAIPTKKPAAKKVSPAAKIKVTTKPAVAKKAAKPAPSLAQEIIAKLNSYAEPSAPLKAEAKKSSGKVPVKFIKVYR